MSVELEIHTSIERGTALPPCPVCHSGTEHIRTVDPELTRQAFDEYFGGNFRLASFRDMDPYHVLRCSQCTLEYADPPCPGSGEFYQELGKQAGYYPSNRWEWGIAIEEMRRSSVSTLIEVGCGAGAFLKMAGSSLNAKATGIDINADAVASCRAAGFEVYCESIEAHRGRFAAAPYDCAVAFHCLEHVENPLVFAQSLFSLVRPGGYMLLSTPLSPMSFERRWHDPLNNPPHHLTRWNEQSYIALADRLKAGLRLFSPAAMNPLRRAAQAIALRIHGTPRKVGRMQLVTLPLLHPVDSARELFHQLYRPDLNGRPAGDVILGVFAKQ